MHTEISMHYAVDGIAKGGIFVWLIILWNERSFLANITIMQIVCHLLFKECVDIIGAECHLNGSQHGFEAEFNLPAQETC